MEYTGVKIFKNSFSAHIKDEFRTMVSFGFSGEEAEEAILEHYRDFQDGLYRGPFWLGLARVETDTGRLSQRVKEEALAVMEDGSDLELWKLAVDLEPDYREICRRNRMKWEREASTIRMVIDAKKKEYENSADEVYRAEMRTEISYVSFAIDRLKERASQMANEESNDRKELPALSPDDGWEPNPLLAWDKDKEAFLHEMRFGTSDDSWEPRLPDHMIRRRLLSEIMRLDGSGMKKLQRRIVEHTALREAMDAPQNPRKIAKPYFTPSPWKDGDVFWLRLKELGEKYSAWENCYVALRVIAVRGRPISLVCPELGRDESASLGLYRWVGNTPPEMEALEQEEYIPWDLFWNVEQKGIRLNLYGERRNVDKWQWKVIGNTPEFSKKLPPFFQEGALSSMMVQFGPNLAWRVASALERSGLAPAKK